jgi:hypothetical protein
MISQVSVAPSVKYFKDALKNRWNLTDYIDSQAPSLFFGVRGQETLIEDHKGFALLYFVDRADKYQGLKKSKNIAAFYSPYADVPEHIPTKKGWIEVRDNSKLIPHRMGSHVFVYLRHPVDRNLMGGKLVDKLKKQIKFPILELCLETPIPFEQVVQDYYSKCFAAVNFTESSGLTTVCDLGLMGVPTFMNTKHTLSSVQGFTDSLDLVRKLNSRSRYINTIQAPIVNYSLNDYWQDVNFWI